MYQSVCSCTVTLEERKKEMKYNNKKQKEFNSRSSDERSSKTKTRELK